MQPISKNGLQDVNELLLDYIRVLNEHEQYEEVALLTPLLDDIQLHFYEIIPKKNRRIHLFQLNDMYNIYFHKKLTKRTSHSNLE